MRLEALDGLLELPATPAALSLAEALLAEEAVPEKARTDAAHIPSPPCIGWSIS